MSRTVRLVPLGHCYKLLLACRAGLTRSNELWLPRLPQQARHLARTCKTGQDQVAKQQ